MPNKKDLKKCKIAVVHDYLVQYGGAEKTMEAVLELFPDADIFTGVYKPESMTENINKHNVITPKNPFLKMFPKYLSFLMPLVFERFDLSEYDIILSDSASWAKGVLTNANQMHISYIHTPPRFLYGYSVESPKRNSWFFKPFISIVDSILRPWDYTAAHRPNYLLVNSSTVQKRVQKFYNLDSKIINPPTDVKPLHDKKKPHQAPDGDFFLGLGRLAAYKNFDLLISAFNELPYNLVIAGTGNEENNLKSISKENIYFTGRVSEEEKEWLLENSLGLINAVEDEDFGIVPIESMARGKPVLAHKSGGHLETIIEGKTGMFFEKAEKETLKSKISEFFEKIKQKGYLEEEIKKHASVFSKENFKEKYYSFVAQKWEEF